MIPLVNRYIIYRTIKNYKPHARSLVFIPLCQKCNYYNIIHKFIRMVDSYRGKLITLKIFRAGSIEFYLEKANLTLNSIEISYESLICVTLVVNNRYYFDLYFYKVKGRKLTFNLRFAEFRGESDISRYSDIDFANYCADIQDLEEVFGVVIEVVPNKEDEVISFDKVKVLYE